uniref:Uncharacterized protein n=1 Tax=Anopheles quadriannulatus TaxID=34691 RepID=A0A2C9H870_ANOQN
MAAAVETAAKPIEAIRLEEPTLPKLVRPRVSRRYPQNPC